MSRRATEHELDTAREIAKEVRRRGGSAALPVNATLEAFGIARFTDASRDRIAEAIEVSRLTAEPSIHAAKRGDLITFTSRDRVQAAAPMRSQPPPVQPVQPRAAGPKRPWYKRPVGIAAICLLLLFLLVGALSDPETDADSQRVAATQTPTPTPTPTATPVSREDAIAEADEAVNQDHYMAAIAAVEAVDDDDDSLVGRYNRKIARRILWRARRALRSGSNTRAIRLAAESRNFHTFADARAVTGTANDRLAAARARKRERARLARIARDNATCSSSEKSTVRYGGGTPAGCSQYAIDLADRRARRAAEKAALADDYGDDGSSGNWCGASKDGDGDGIWCEGESADEYGDSSSDGGGSSGNWCGASRDGDGDGIWCEGQ